MSSTSLSINPFLIKDILYSYTDSKSFQNYQKIARDYYKLYSKIIKKYSNISKDKLRAEVKNWFFNQSLESRIKLCTVENEFFCQIIYQMYLYTQLDKSMKFYIKQEFIDINELNQNNILKNNDYNYNDNETENTDFFEFENYFKCKSEIYSSYSFTNKYNLLQGGIYNNEYEENDIKYNSSIDEFIKEIKFYSVHHKPYPDCFCLSPNFLLKEERFDTTFNYLGNINYFSSLIQPFYINEKNIYGYNLPSWIINSYSYSLTQYIFAFIEQTIMIKFILNNYIIYNNKKNTYNKNNKTNASIFSLINDENLNHIFVDRKTVINYLNMKYNDINLKKELINDVKIDIIFDKILKNNKIMNKIVFFKNFRRQKNYNGFAGSLLVQPLLGINSNNIYNTLYDDIRSFLYNNPKEQNNFLINKIKSNIIDIIETTDNIIFVDYLLFQNFKGLWEVDYFINQEIIEYTINLFNELNYNDLLKEEMPSSKKKNNRRKKKKKNQTNNNDNEDNNNKNKKNNNINEAPEKKEENKNNLYNIELECYNELFKDKEKLLYIPYYFNMDFDLKIKYNKIKENKLKLIEKSNKKQFIKEIYNYIKNEFLLKYIIDKVIHLQPDNYVNFFENDNIEKNNDKKEIKINKIHGLKLRKPKNNDIFYGGDNFGSITINLNLNQNNKIIINADKDKDKDKNVDTEKDEDKINNSIENDIRDIKNIANSLEQNIIINNKEENNDNIINYNNNNLKNIEEKINEVKDKIVDKNIKTRSNSNSSNKNSHKKRQKSPNIFFLFDTVKNKNKKKPKSKSPNAKKLENNNNLKISFISPNISKMGNDNHLFFMEKLHNDILKNEIKVNNILQILSKFKNYCIEEVKTIIKNAYNNNLFDYSIDLYGSFITGLMIEASDIDIRIKINGCRKEDFEKYFFILYNKVEDEKKFESITPIITASVPVIKLILNIEKFINKEKNLEKDFIKFKQLSIFKNYLFDKKELLQIKIDVTFIVNYLENNNSNNFEIINKAHNDKLNPINNILNNNDNEISNISYIKKQLDEYPEIRPILKLLKRYFYIKKMNSSFEGGLSSYNLFLLILSYAKYQKLYNLNPYKKVNLGFFLVQFLEFFGNIFDFKNYLININSPYIYELNHFSHYNSGKSLIILDPITGLNASKSSYKIGEIQNMFLNAFNYFEKEKINYENDIIKNERNDKRNNDKKNNYEVILGLSKVNKHDIARKNNKNKTNIIDKFFFE